METLEGGFDIEGGDTGWYDMGGGRGESSAVAAGKKNTINVAEVAALRKVEVHGGGAVHVGAAVTLTQMESELKKLKVSKEHSEIIRSRLAMHLA